MKLTFSILAEKMLQLLDCEPLLLQCPSPMISVRAAMQGLPPAKSRTDTVYIAKFEEYLNCSVALPACSVLIAEESFSSFDFTQHMVKESGAILLLPALEAQAVFAAAQEAFLFYDEWQETLYDILRQGSGWFPLLDHAHKLFRNPMLIYDRNMKVLAYTRNDGTQDTLWTDTVAHGTAPIGGSEESEALELYVKLSEENEHTFRHKSGGMSDPFLSCSIRLNGKRYGMVTETEYNHPVTAGEADLLELFAGILSIEMQRSAGYQPGEDAYRRLIMDLAGGSVTDPRRLATRLTAVNWKVSRYFFVLLLEQTVPYISEARRSIAAADLQLLAASGIACTVSAPKPLICCIYSSPLPELTPIDQEKLRQFCSSHALRCGGSDVFEDLTDVPRHWDQAESVLNFGSGLLSFYHEVRWNKLRQQINAAPFPEDLLHPAVLKLAQIDRETGSEYIHTLKTLCDCEFRQVDAAARLCIHRTTLSYRLRKAEELTGLNLTDARSMLHIWLSLTLRET